MKKIFFYTFLIIFFVVCIFFVSSNYENEKISPEVYNSLENNNDVRIIINIKEPENEKGIFIKTKKTQSEINSEKEEIKEEILTNLQDEEVNHIFENSVAIEVSNKEIDFLKTDKNIESVEIDMPVKAFLKDTTVLINATKSWPVQVYGVNITGISESVCVIDTGVNSTHSSLQGKVIAEHCYCSLTEGINADCCEGNLAESSNASDNNGHGTHVAGIIAAAGGIKGIGVNVSIVAVKVLNSSGDGLSSDIQAAIDWCISNASLYNISVISMSLGGGLYNSYCNSDSLAPSINSAVGNNISVVVATGNRGNTTHIASPACIQNATSVSSSTKSDAISSFSDRNNITNLLAPGGDATLTGGINSTRWNSASCISSCFCAGDYMVCSGTSMAAPHVSGAFALVRQFFRLQNGRVPTPYEIEAILNNTGKRITDSATGLNFSRVDILSAILSLDSILPNVTLISPANNTVTLNNNQTFLCNATDAVQLSNITFFIWNSSNSLINQTTSRTSEFYNLLSINITSLSYGEYKWNCLAYDVKGNPSYMDTNFSFSILNLTVSLNSPADNTFTNQNQTFFNCSSQTTLGKLENITLFVWNSSRDLIYNLTTNISGNLNSTLFQYNFTNEFAYSWNCLASNNLSQYALANLNYTFTYDITIPNISLISPAEAYSSTDSSVAFSFNVTDLTPTNCSLILDGIEINFNSSVNKSGGTNSFTNSTSVGSHSWSINCTDSVSNKANSQTRNFTITNIVQTVSSSGGGGGGGSIFTTQSIYKPTAEQTSGGYRQELKKDDKVIFIFFDDLTNKHNLSMDYIGSNFVNITIYSNPIKLFLGVGQSVKMNITSPDYYNLYLKLDSISDKKANLTIQTIHEPILNQDKTRENNSTENKTVKSEDNTEINKRINSLSKIVDRLKIIIFMIIIAFIALIIVLFKKRGQKRESRKRI
ncbi:MAG: S8 family serine peptidase [Nanoarchaeota archaeon]